MHSPESVPSDIALRCPTIVIGNFDGVHLGHRFLLAKARAIGAPVLALTFEPHPRTVLVQDAPPFRLTSAEDKTRALIEAGADHVVPLTFDVVLAAVPSERFVREILVQRLGAGVVVIGHDYRFGRDRGGDGDLLKALGRELGFRVLAIPPFVDRFGIRYASSYIRELVADGRVGEAARSLGRRWAISGVAKTVPGCGVELPLGDYLRPAAGRYAVEVHRPEEAAARGIAVVRGETDSIILPGSRRGGPLVVTFDRLLGNALPDLVRQRQGADNFSPCL